MKKKILISTIGFDPKSKKPNFGPLISGLFLMTPREIKEVYLLSNQDDETWLSSIVEQFPYLRNHVQLSLINSFEYESIIKAIMEIYSSYLEENIDFIVNITGGTKVMTVGAFIGAILIGASVQYIKKAETPMEDPEVFEIKMPKIPVNQLHDVQKVILLVLKNHAGDSGLIQSEVRRKIIKEYTGTKASSIGKKQSISPQKMSYHCDILEKNGLISRTHDDVNRKVNILKLTRIGSILTSFISK
ncbi:MAG: MarR family transcriptional regulator [Promethearchaeota archaeon]